MIEWVMTRASRATRVDRVVLATTDSPKDDALAAHISALGYAVERGSESDVLARFAAAALAQGADVVVRITADCPFIDPALVDAVIALREAKDADYASNADPATYPDGLDVEVFTATALARAAREAESRHDREHVTPYLRRDPFNRAALVNATDLSALRWTVDEAADLAVADRLAQAMGRMDFTWEEALTQAWAAVRNSGDGPSRSYLAAACFCPKGPRCSCPTSGPPISAGQRAAPSGTWMGANTSI
jgi:glutamate-1-semialdehyde 2,1-aminomutase